MINQGKNTNCHNLSSSNLIDNASLNTWPKNFAQNSPNKNCSSSGMLEYQKNRAGPRVTNKNRTCNYCLPQ